jgi:hypothetical protein
VYPVFRGGVGEDIPFFSPHIDSLCYPLIYPFGEVLFENSTIPLSEPLAKTQEELNRIDSIDHSDHEEEVQDDGEYSDTETGHTSEEEQCDHEEELEEQNQVLRPTEDDELEADPPTDDEREDPPLLPGPKIPVECSHDEVSYIL